MTVYNTYSIDFQGLSDGVHHFEFDIDDTLFSLWEESEIRHGKGKAVIRLTKRTSMMELETHITSWVELVCDRCLEDFTMPVNFHGNLVVRLTDQEIEEESDGDIMWLSPQADRLPLAQYLYESIVLSLPYQRVHGEMTDCNPEMLAKFSIVSLDEFEALENRMGERTLEDEQEQDEPRQFEKLRALKEEMENDTKPEK